MMAKIDSTKWRSFTLLELGFVNYHGSRLNKAERVEGETPFLTAGKENQGLSTYVSNEIETYLNPITVDMFGNCFYHPFECGGDDNVYFFVNETLSDYSKIFIAASINTITSKKYSYKDQFRQSDADALSVILPMSQLGLPDWEYMDAYVSKVLRESEASLENLKQASTLKRQIDITRWKKFKLTDIFNMNNTKSIVQKSIEPNSGKTPYVTAQAGNNGVLTYIVCPNEWKDDGNCIMIGGKTLTFSYQKEPFCSNDSHNIVLYLKDKSHETEISYLFLIVVLRKALSQKYSWGDSISMTRIKEDTFQLPVKQDGNPDWEYMDAYMSKVLRESEGNLENLIHGVGD